MATRLQCLTFVSIDLGHSRPNPRHLETFDLDVLYAAPAAATPRSLAPPLLFAVAPPLPEEPTVTKTSFILRTTRKQRLLAVGGIALLGLGLGALLGLSGRAEAYVPPAAPIQVQAAIEAPAPPPPPAPAVVNLPPPPATGTAGTQKPPPKIVAAAKPRLKH